MKWITDLDKVYLDLENDLFYGLSTYETTFEYLIQFVKTFNKLEQNLKLAVQYKDVSLWKKSQSRASTYYQELYYITRNKYINTDLNIIKLKNNDTYFLTHDYAKTFKRDNSDDLEELQLIGLKILYNHLQNSDIKTKLEELILKEL